MKISFQKSKKGGVIEALLDEHEYAIQDLLQFLTKVSDEDLLRVADSRTKNKDCVSIQSVLTHIIFCGDNYLAMIDQHRGNNPVWPKRIPYESVAAYQKGLIELHNRNIAFFESLNDKEMASFAADKKLTTTWGQIYDYEQLMEHAIVHIYRHRRQIRFFI